MPKVSRIAVLAGDRREWEAAFALAEAGYEVVVVGYAPRHPTLPVRARCAEAFQGAQAVIAPVRGIAEDGVFYRPEQADAGALAAEDLAYLPTGAPFFIGQARRWLIEAARRHRLDITELNERDDFALRNAVPTAEGAIARAIQASPYTLSWSRALVLGYGRCGKVLADRLARLGADVTVVARRSEQRAHAEALGLRSQPFVTLAELLPEAEFVFNTVPAQTLPANLLRLMAKTAVIIDIAAAPGGTDFEAADQLGIHAELALGLPGLTAPKTAGRILAQTVLELLKE